jgi:hypothetical protein
MTKIAISVLHPNAIEAFIHNLTPEQAEIILGGVSTFPYSNGIMNITDSTYIYFSPRQDRRLIALGPNSYGFHEGTFNSVDNSRAIYNKFI